MCCCDEESPASLSSPVIKGCLSNLCTFALFFGFFWNIRFRNEYAVGDKFLG
jgi:hypothetical protein